MTNPPSTAPDGATADSGGKLEAKAEQDALRLWALFPTAEPSDPAERYLHQLRAEQAWITPYCYAWFRYEDMINAAIAKATGQ